MSSAASGRLRRGGGGGGGDGEGGGDSGGEEKRERGRDDFQNFPRTKGETDYRVSARSLSSHGQGSVSPSLQRPVQSATYAYMSHTYIALSSQLHTSYIHCT